MKPLLSFLVACWVIGIGAGMPAGAQDTVFSGPQPGEKAVPFRVLEVVGVTPPRETELLRETSGPVTLVFWHGIERSMLPLLRVVDQYATERKGKLSLHHVILSGDRVDSERRVPLVQQSLKLGVPPVLSPDGAEGPGAYGLNKRCLLTILVVKEGKVTANFALVQPGIADGPKVIKAMAEASGDTAPPTVEDLDARWMASHGGQGRGERPAAMAPVGNYDLNTEKGLRDAVKVLLAEVAALKAEVAALKAEKGAQPVRPPTRGEQPASLPGAAPTDPKLMSLLRAFIQPTNTDARVDEVLKEVREYVQGKPDLTKQAIDGWVRVLYLKYGTEYARTTGQTFVESLKK